jgi:hypothetical protein
MSGYATGWLLACQIGWLLTSQGSQISLLILKETSEAVSEAPPAEEFPGFAWTPGVERYMTSRSYAAKRA